MKNTHITLVAVIVAIVLSVALLITNINKGQEITQLEEQVTQLEAENTGNMETAIQWIVDAESISYNLLDCLSQSEYESEVVDCLYAFYDDIKLYEAIYK